jgi:hypothetical protein
MQMIFKIGVHQLVYHDNDDFVWNVINEEKGNDCTNHFELHTSRTENIPSTLAVTMQHTTVWPFTPSRHQRGVHIDHYNHGISELAQLVAILVVTSLLFKNEYHHMLSKSYTTTRLRYSSLLLLCD